MNNSDEFVDPSQPPLQTQSRFLSVNNQKNPFLIIVGVLALLVVVGAGFYFLSIQKAKKTAIGTRPLGDRVIVEPSNPHDEALTRSGIIIPETVQKDGPIWGKVLAIGSGKFSDSGALIPMTVKVGNKVLFKKGYESSEVEVDGKKYLVGSEDDILAIIE